MRISGNNGYPIYGYGVDETVLEAGAARQRVWNDIAALAKVAGYLGADPSRTYDLGAPPPADSGISPEEHEALRRMFPDQSSLTLFHVNSKMSVLQMHDSVLKTDIDTIFLGGVRQTQSSRKSNADKALQRG